MPNTKIDKKKSSKQSYIMSLRLDKETYQKLNQISHKNNVKKSELLRNSFNEWINMKKVLIKSDSIVIGKIFLKGLLDNVEEKKIIDLGKTIAEIWINEFNIHLIDMEAKEDLSTMISIFTDGIGPNEANWFEKINYQKMDNDKILIYGIHTLNKKFSIFFKSFLEYLMAVQFGLILMQKSSTISDTTIRFEFKLDDKS